MPASSAEMRAKWRKRKRDQLARKSRLKEKEQENEDAFEDNEDDDDPDLDPPHNNHEGVDDPRNHSMDKIGQPKAEKEGEKVNGGSKVCEFPVAIRREVTRHHSLVFQIVEAEKAAHYGNVRSMGHNALPVLENISYGQLQALSVLPRDSPALIAISADESTGTGSYVITPPRITAGRGVTKKLGSAGRVHVLPVHSEWFSTNSVHRLERQVVSHIFLGSSNDCTPEKYMECRNFIVAKYMENPEKHLSVSDCQGLVDGFDTDDLTRVVRFLDHWGIINYCASNPKEKAMKDGTYMSEDSNGELQVPSDALKSIDSLVKFDNPKCKLKPADIYPELARQDEVIDIDSSIREQLSDYLCYCCFKSIPTLYYQSQREVDIRLCSDCFHEGKFIVGHSSLDFVKESSIRDYVEMDGDNWSDQETLLLLEGVQQYKENWSKIAEHVVSKSKAQCILHFVRIPLDYTLLNDIVTPSTSGSVNYERGRSELENGYSWVGEDAEGSFPFLNSENPVMHLVAFLSSALGPRVAAACAHASLASLSKDCGKEGSPVGEINSMKKGPRSQDEANGVTLIHEKVRAAAKDGLEAAAMKSKLFADHEEREIQRLSANIVNHQLKRLELKLKQFAEVETLLMRECEQMERARQRIAAERAAMMSSPVGSSGESRLMTLPGTIDSVMNNAIGNSRRQQLQQQQQQQILASQQHFTSGYDKNQPIYPHISMMQQQQGMYGLSPRPPMSALRPSSPMFNPTLNSQTPLGHAMLRPLSGSK